MEIHTFLASDVAAFDFHVDDFVPLEKALPGATLRHHQRGDDLLTAAESADYILTWQFHEAWYARFPSLKKVFTPAAGSDWVAADPDGRVELVHGTFHGWLLGESLLGAILFMNRCMPDMIRNFRRREWDRNIQKDSRLLANQKILIVGLGHIGAECARMLQSLGATVTGLKRDPATLPTRLDGVDVRSATELEAILPESDHLVLLLPGTTGTDRLLDETRLKMCKPGAYVYNFGRGNAIASDDLLAASDHIGGAFLDVVDEEPLAPDSPLWSLDNVMITPHSSCIYREYKLAFIDEVIKRLAAATRQVIPRR